MLFELEENRNKRKVFVDRSDAGAVLAKMMAEYRNSDQIVLAIAAGGVEVAVELAGSLQLDLQLLVVSKITPVWNSEVGIGAAAWDGSVEYNHDLIRSMRVREEDYRQWTAETVEKIGRRMKNLGASGPEVKNKDVILVDDGLASGYTMKVAISALKHAKVAEISVAVPTAHSDTAEWIEKSVSNFYCANIRTGLSFAVADAYQSWYDITEEQVISMLNQYRQKQVAGI